MLLMRGFVTTTAATAASAGDAVMFHQSCVLLLAAVTTGQPCMLSGAAYAGDTEELCEEILTYMASHPSVAKFAVPDDCVIVQVGARHFPVQHRTAKMKHAARLCLQ